VTALDPFVPLARVAYFSMEMALRSEIPTYAGGLGVLAGDTLRAAADLEIPMVGVTLISHQGYFRQAIDAQGAQVEEPDPWNPERWMERLDAKIAVHIEGRKVWVQTWLYVLRGGAGFQNPILMLDTDLEENSPLDRDLTHYLYGKDDAYRLKQEVVLGIGGVRILQALGFDIHAYHLNEGHSALLALELLRRSERPPRDVSPGDSIYDVTQVRELCLFTTHTPVGAGHDQFGYDLVWRTLDDFVDLQELKHLAGKDALNMTQLAMSLSNYVNGVARSHAETSNHMFPGYHVHTVTNGVHGPTWTSPAFARLFDRYVPPWRHEPELMVRADRIPDTEVWQAHVQAKQDLVNTLQERTGAALDIEQPLFGFARRMAAYKRPNLLFSDLARLRAIAAKHPFSIVLAGKAHPRDSAGRGLIQLLHDVIASLRGDINVVFVPNYDMDISRKLVSGADVWLNTPLPPMEASGTSGMKAAFNGVLNLSVLDGWWLEGCIDGVTGWAVGDHGRDGLGPDSDAGALYDLLENTVLPLYYDDRAAWTAMMKQAIAKNAYYFNSHRMMRRYASEAYIR